ncbi:MAG: HD domain-containing protein [Acidimicrobiia bacterium]
MSAAASKQNQEHDINPWHKNVSPRVWRTSIVSTLLFIAGIAAYRVDQYQWLGILAIFTATIIVGENLELKLTDRPPIPISFAAVLALARTNTNIGEYSWVHVSAVALTAAFVSTLCYSHVSILRRLQVFGARASTYFIGIVFVHFATGHTSPTSQLLYVALIAGIVLMLAWHELLAFIDGYPRVYGFFAAAAHASVVAGAVLIGVGYAGTKNLPANWASPEAGGNGLGISALFTCAIPLLVAWFAFARYYGALRTYKQTVKALSAAPELGGIVAWGHADRVARIAGAVAERLDLDREDRQAIETACYMHTLGDAVLDTTVDVDPYEESQAANVTADIIRQTGGLDRVADIIEDHVRPYRGVIDGNLVAQNDIAASVMRVANDYDNISRREETWGSRALVEMLTASAANYNPRALEALEWVLSRDRYADLIDPPQMPEYVQEHLNS